MNPRSARYGIVVLVLALTGCGQPRVMAVDAVTGAPLIPRIEELADGRLLVGADGHEVRVARPGDMVSLTPLWEARFMSPEERPPPRPERDARPCCPGKQAR